MFVYKLSLLSCLIITSQCCVPTRPPDPGIPVSSARSSGVVQAPATAVQSPAAATAAPAAAGSPAAPAPTPIPTCQTCKPSDIPVDTRYANGSPYARIEETVVNGCTQLKYICEPPAGQTCTSNLDLYVLDDVNLYTVLGTATPTQGSGVVSCMPDGKYHATIMGADQVILKYFCDLNSCS